MLKGHVFEKQVFGNQIFALFINTFLNGVNGVSNNYKNGMKVTYSGSTLTVQSGAVCVQGRFLEEDTSTNISAGTDVAYCKLVIEVNLDSQNTESDFTQAKYKIVKSTTGYPELTQNNIVKNNSGIYQYELARFRTNANGITEFSDKRTFLNFDSIYQEIKQHIQDIDDGTLFVQKSSIAIVTGTLVTPEANSGTLNGTVTLEYPNGYEKDNCMILSLMSSNLGIANSNYNTVGSTGRSIEEVKGNYGLQAGLGTTGIVVSVFKVNDAAEAKQINIKILLMKIA